MVQVTRVFHLAIMACYAAAFALSLARLAVRKLPRSAPSWPLALGVVLQIVLFILRWNASGHFPVTGLYETLSFLVFWVAAVTFYFDIRYKAEAFVPAAMGLALAALAWANQPARMAVFPLTPSLDTPLFLIHVATSFAAYGLFALAGLLGIYNLAGARVSLSDAGRRMMDESLYLGYILFSWCMIVGCIWAYLAWGSYWTWNMKGLWSFILWFYYSGVLHIRNRPTWQGRPVSILALAGFALTLFTYLGLGLLFKTNHPLT